MVLWYANFCVLLCIYQKSFTCALVQVYCMENVFLYTVCMINQSIRLRCRYAAVSQKTNPPHCCCPYFRQKLTTDFQNSFTGTFTKKVAMKLSENWRALYLRALSCSTMKTIVVEISHNNNNNNNRPHASWLRDRRISNRCWPILIRRLSPSATNWTSFLCE